MSKVTESSGPSVVCLVIEIEQKKQRNGAAHYTVVTSRPGVESTFSRTWQNAAGRLTVDQGFDLACWVTKTAMDALVVWGGLQERLDV